MKPEWDRARGSGPQCANIYSFNTYNLRKSDKVLGRIINKSTKERRKSVCHCG